MTVVTENLTKGKPWPNKVDRAMPFENVFSERILRLPLAHCGFNITLK